MALAGYSAREIADVVSGHLARGVVDAAHAMLLAGRPRELVSAFLEARWREVSRPMPEPVVPVTSRRRPLRLSPVLDAHLVELSRQHGIDPALVRAVVSAESRGRPDALSRAGAIGLMQLMPATAANLQVDPWDPLQNLRGGVAYLAGLLRAYGTPRLALVAYNAGPQHADRVRGGVAVPYRETRQYLEAIAALYPIE
jgi:soluble lytic murein transglycosylase-like protein